MLRHRRHAKRYCCSGKLPVLKSLPLPGVVLIAVTGTLTAQDDAASAPCAAVRLEWSSLPAIPDSHGVAGPFVGVAGDALIVAGGANFPDGFPWKGGVKVWHDGIHVLPDPEGAWKTVGHLPEPLAYGIAVSWRDRMVLIGGGDAERHSTAVTALSWDGHRISMQKWPDLPAACAFMTGLVYGDRILVVGGIDAPDSASAMTSVWSLSLESEAAQRRWETWPALKTGRILAQSAVVGGRLLIAGGAELHRDETGTVQRRFLRDAWLLDLEKLTWTPAADAPRPIVAAPSPGIASGQSAAVFLSGDDGRYFGRVLKDGHPGFPAETYVYHANVDCWQVATPFPKSVPSDTGPLRNQGCWPPVTTGVVEWRGRYVIPSGEIRPGIRSPAVYAVEVTRNPPARRKR